ncbi:alpha-isopropylmalate synthase regulatory domain-containing protein [Streptomyces sp. NPDC002994]|uniref:alpha-isopropylmalate synthase regulatory domain-containing protein n=1 Tax=Streptomyces sp. NPDC002994 TaxID=3154441 RepID=UPI0033B399EA
MLHEHYGLDLPQGLRPGFSRVVQAATDDSGREATPEDLWELFRTEYLAPGHVGPVTLSSWSTAELAAGQHEFTCELRKDGGPARRHRGTGNGPLAAFADALAGAGIVVDILGYTGHATTAGPGSPAMAYAECRVDGVCRWGAGQDTSVLNASVYAVLAAVNRTLTEDLA